MLCSTSQTINHGLLYGLLYGLLRSLLRGLLYGLLYCLLYGLLYDLLYGLPRDLLYGPAAVDKQPVQPVQPGINSATLTPSYSTGIFPSRPPIPLRFYI